MKSKKLPTSRIARLAKLGRLAGGVVGGALGEGIKQVSRGNRPALHELMLTPQNFQRVSDRLSEMRGAAMKVGQLISMEGGDFIPRELSELLARLRSSAYRMPLGDLAKVLKNNWGEEWQHRFEYFNFTPLASASIGQVHQARLKDGCHVAIKIQYPGVRQSIDSDVDNVSSLLNMVRLIPKQLDLTELLEEAKLQLHQEADYLREANYLKLVSGYLENDDRFQVPTVYDDLTTQEVLCMEYLEGIPIDEVNRDQADTSLLGSHLLELALRELFDWGIVQTDPNFANFQYDPDSGRIQLLDYGACRDYAPQRRHAFLDLINRSLSLDMNGMEAAATQVGYLLGNEPHSYRETIFKLIRNACEPLSDSGPYHFGQSDIANRMADITIQMRKNQKHGQLPPADVLFLHRKIGGLYFILQRLQSVIDVPQLFEPYRLLSEAKAAS